MYVIGTEQKGPAMNSTTEPSPLWTALRTQLRTRQARRVAHRTLVRELATYTTPAERSELDAILARHDSAEAAEIRRIVSWQRAA